MNTNVVLRLAENYMQRCLELAQLGAGFTAPNPMVGCVIVYENQIIGEGYTSPYGGNHAEVNAINSIKDSSLLPSSTLYVSLEPCAHFGKTPPCSDLIIKTGIKKVVIGCQDSFSKVNGAGIKKLRESGVDVVTGILKAECRNINRRFFTFHEKKRPYIILKWAETANGFIDKKRRSSKEKPLKITCEESTILVHKWRAEEAAIMVGKTTALLDNPSLTTRKFQGSNATRILVDQKLEVPNSNRILNHEAKTIILNTIKNSKDEFVEYVKVSDTRNMTELMHKLYERNILSILVEGGAKLHNSFYQLNLWDEIRKFTSIQSINTGVAALSIDKEPERVTLVGTDKLHLYRNR